MMPRSYDDKDKAFIVDNCSYITVTELAEQLSLKPGIIYQLLRKMKLTFKSAKVEKTVEFARMLHELAVQYFKDNPDKLIKPKDNA